MTDRPRTPTPAATPKQIAETREKRSNLPTVGEAGFSLAELLVAMTIAIFVLLAVAVAVDVASQVSRVELEKTDLQQALRGAQRTVARSVRMAGRGGLPSLTVATPVHQTPALAVRNQIGSGLEIAPGFAGSPTIVEDTDVLTLRGVFDSPIYQVNSADSNTLVLAPDDADPTTAETGRVVVNNPGPAGVPQSLTPLCTAIRQGVAEALILTSPLGPEVYAVVELDPGSSVAPADCTNPAQVTAAFRVTAGTRTGPYRALMIPNLAAGLPSTLRTVASIGILEEHRYYLRDETTPVLTRARFFPNTDQPWGRNAAEQLDSLTTGIADGLLDFQVALGFDSPLGGWFEQDANNDGADDRILEAANGEEDDWLFNAAADDAVNAPWSPPWNNAANPRPNLYYLRMSFLGRTLRFERDHVSPALTAIEDRDYSEPPNAAAAARPERLYRRSLVTTLVEMRNL